MTLNNTAILPVESPIRDFERLYITLRKQEQRLYTDEQVTQLPNIDALHVHYNEWKIRKHSANRLIGYLSKKKRALNILEIGCGNGWLSAQLAKIKGANVIGQDINRVEIDQAKRVFHKNNLQFFCEDFNAERFKDLRFDVIIFAASVQYFPSLKQILNHALNCLSAGGEIHLIDTNFYNHSNIDSAKERTLVYYTKMGCPELAAYYFHHLLDDLKGFDHQILANPNTIINKLLKGNPFYWISIKKK
ncbi:class I SAM-dependent methyltransferase [Mucilaginibacter sp.]|jgi:2-polyprenyl-3-methyl-5-hydroxy-6-metoxy-1,4-benzoquinol methylase|uniref:class I SAM-dependent methyltransferase n=1 Tax=Mucilaginibacter sp. TaxID=1882438 RepID=UPI0035623076